LAEAPLLEGIVESVKADLLVSLLRLLNVFVYGEFSLQRALLQEEVVKFCYVLANVFHVEVGVVGLQGEVLENLLSFQVEETSDLLLDGVRLKQLLKLKLNALVRVIAHQVLAQENAWVETSANARINLICPQRLAMIFGWLTLVFDGALDFAREFFEGRHEHRV